MPYATRFLRLQDLRDDPDYCIYFRSFIKLMLRNNEVRLHEMLISEGDAVFKANKCTGETVLHIAARFGSVSLVNHIMELGADVNVKDDLNKITPLYWAIMRSSELVELLLMKGADVSVSDSLEINSLQCALLYGSIEVIQLIMCYHYGREVHLKKERDSAVNDVEKCKEVVKILSEVDVNLNWKRYPTLIHFVAKYGDEETFKLVLKESKDFSINAVNSNKNTLLHELVQANKTNLIYYILEYGADIKARGPFRKTALNDAILKNDSSLVRLLLDHGGDVHYRDEYNCTPLYYALVSGSKEIIKMLMDAGADVNVKWGYCPLLFIACGYPLPWSQHVLRPFIAAEKSWHGCNLEIIKLLIANGINLDESNNIGSTAFLEACAAGRLDIVQFFLNAGYDYSDMDFFNRSEIHYAALGNNVDTVCFFLDKGFYIDVEDSEGLTALLSILNYTLKSQKNNDYIDMMELLADNGAKIDGFKCLQVLRDGNNMYELGKIECLLELANLDDFLKYGAWSDYFGGFGGNDEKVSQLFTAIFAVSENDLLFSQCWKLEANSFEDQYPEYRKIFLTAKRLAESFFQVCKFDVQNMKSTNIYSERNVSYFNFLSKKLLEVVPFTNNIELMQVLDSGMYKEDFPCYAFLLEKRIERVKKLQIYMIMIKQFLQNEYAQINLPVVVLDKIFSYWNTGDVRNFGRVLATWWR